MKIGLNPNTIQTPNSATHEPNQVSTMGSSAACLTRYKIPSYLVNPERLIVVLRAKFNENYKVKVRNDNYSISTPRKLTENELIQCY
ncbi:uncharacterized protein F4807DRAFT_432168 [Annulohypoxylon truncatum]|uniref:uncharacterized protein n=1 Tax=Annulohypoxylon truncatum TaxID=327061 RepID=UPI0020083DB6|nr:uncharacterized protein F4807DRAFT_432168 [Annulohypoxylon truncatum]KAI1208246.1 hypothetical protein F4807DRAFT_432168 [Annulohypoxylon truncatum]